MHLETVRTAHLGAAHLVQPQTYPARDVFERLPVNLSADEIRALVLELLG